MKHIGIDAVCKKLISFAAAACMVLVLLPAKSVKAETPDVTRNFVNKDGDQYDLIINVPDSSNFYFHDEQTGADNLINSTKDEYGFEYVPAGKNLILEGVKKITTISPTDYESDFTITVSGDNTITCDDKSLWALNAVISNVVFDVQPNSKLTLNSNFEYDFPAILANKITVKNGTIANGENIVEYKDRYTADSGLTGVTIGTAGYPSPQVVISNGDPYDMTTQPVYRLYNYENGEHLYTTDVNERNILFSTEAWDYEDVAWYAPKAENYSGSAPVYRLYNAGLGNHLYTTDQNEVNVLCTSAGWQMDNNGQPLFYSGGSSSIYRLYNAGMAGMHLLTTDSNEYNALPGMTGGAWAQEGAKLNCVKVGK